jgi:hypothetical protein
MSNRHRSQTYFCFKTACFFCQSSTDESVTVGSLEYLMCRSCLDAALVGVLVVDNARGSGLHSYKCVVKVGDQLIVAAENSEPIHIARCMQAVDSQLEAKRMLLSFS